MHGYRFRALAEADLPLVERWLHTPEVVRWWGDPQAQLDLIAGDLHDPRMRQWIVEHDGRAFAYVQAYAVEAWPQPQFAALPPGALAVDPFIGAPEMLGAGHGSNFLRALALQLIDGGAPVVVIDPEPDNLRARQAYARAGFTGDEVVDGDDGPVVVMRFVR